MMSEVADDRLLLIGIFKDVIDEATRKGFDRSPGNDPIAWIEAQPGSLPAPANPKADMKARLSKAKGL